MKELITIYKNNYAFIENSLTSIIESIDFDDYNNLVSKSIFILYPSLKASYKINKKYKQSTPLYTQNNVDNSYLGLDKSHLLGRIKFRDDNKYVSNIYVNSRTGTPYITVVIQTQDEFIVCDFELYALLKELSLIEGHKYFNVFTKYIYTLFGLLLSLFSLFLIFYAIFSIYSTLINPQKELLAGLFQSIIALTLALAIFDLSKTILEHEVFYKSLSRNYNLENRLLARFLTSIIIALSIESLMVVFKIALSDYSKMIYAFYLICGVAIMILSLSVYIFVMRYKGRTEV